MLSYTESYVRSNKWQITAATYHKRNITMFDAKSLSIKESTVIHLTHPATGEKLYADDKNKEPVTVTVASTSSRDYRVAVNAMHNRAIKRGNKKLTAEQQKEESIELLVACCLDSENLSVGGEPVKTDAAFRELLADDHLSWIKQQIDEALGTVELFI
jgi:hypothetical protein